MVEIEHKFELLEKITSFSRRNTRNKLRNNSIVYKQRRLDKNSKKKPIKNVNEKKKSGSKYKKGDTK